MGFYEMLTGRAKRSEKVLVFRCVSGGLDKAWGPFRVKFVLRFSEA